MKTNLLILFLIFTLLEISCFSQNDNRNNDTIFFRRKNEKLKCEIVAITKNKIFYRINPDATILYENFLYIIKFSNNKPQLMDKLINDTIACFDIEGKCGFINNKGDILITAIYENANNFSEGLANVRKYNYWGYIDIKENLIIDTLFTRAEPFKNGLARVEYKGMWGYIDKSGNWVIKPEFDKLWDFVIMKK